MQEHNLLLVHVNGDEHTTIDIGLISTLAHTINANILITTYNTKHKYSDYHSNKSNFPSHLGRCGKYISQLEYDTDKYFDKVASINYDWLTCISTIPLEIITREDEAAFAINTKLDKFNFFDLDHTYFIASSLVFKLVASFNEMNTAVYEKVLLCDVENRHGVNLHHLSNRCGLHVKVLSTSGLGKDDL